MNDTSLIKSYGFATRLLGPLTPMLIRRRASQGKEDLARSSERHGITTIKRPEGRLFWFHGASVGECTMLLPLLKRILDQYNDAHVLVTSGTKTSADIMAQRLPKRAIHQYIPLDYPKAVRRFLEHWKPDMAIWAESEIWPNLLRLTRERNVPMALINARMSETSINNWKNRSQKSAKALFGKFDVVLAADEKTANGLSWLLDKPIETPGNLKHAAEPLPVNMAVLKDLKSQTSRRKIWCAASTHPGEDEIMIAAHKALLSRYRTALLILAPRHPERSHDIAKLLETNNLSYVTRSSGNAVGRDTQVYLFDTIGEMGLAYRLSHLSFVCGSTLKGLSGHNPLEPARLENAVLTGPHISSFADTFMHMMSFDAAKRILSPDLIAPALLELFSDSKALKSAQTDAQIYANGRDAVLDYVWAHLEPLIPEPHK